MILFPWLDVSLMAIGHFALCMMMIDDEKSLAKEAEKIGFPVILKASAGGGEKGLRLVKNEKELVSSFRLARSEAESSFDDPSVYIEKYIQEPHHIEVQILADKMGNFVSREQAMYINNEYPKESMESTLIHEIVEAIDFTYNLELDHHKICVLESGLYQAIKQLINQ